MSDRTLRESVHGLALLLPALGPCVRGLRAVRKGQVGGDGVPDAVAQHGVVAVVGAGQLSSAKAGRKKKESRGLDGCVFPSLLSSLDTKTGH